MAANAEYTILVAGGTGSRMQNPVPKQFMLLGGQPVLMRTIRQFLAYNPRMPLMVVLPADQIKAWQQLCRQYTFTLPHQVVAGGATRFSSVKNGLAAITAGAGVVAVHDGVRPLVPLTVIREAFAVAAAQGNAVAAVALKESIRQLIAAGSQALDRNQYRLVQTPQCFALALLRRAYEQPEEPLFTDDAAVVERLGEPIYLTAGAYENIKITTPEDLIWAESFLRRNE